MANTSDTYNFTTADAQPGDYIPVPSNGNLTVDLSGMTTKQVRGHFLFSFYNLDNDGNYVDATPTAGTIEFHWRFDEGYPWNDTEAGAIDLTGDSAVVRADTAYRDARMVLDGVDGAAFVRAFVARWEG